MKIILGTAQFGRDYGIANKVGKVPYDEVLKIISLASNNGIVHVDTASDYGKSETILGQAKEELGIDLKVSTKLYEEFDRISPEEVLIKIRCALDRLRVDKLDSLLIHQPFWLLNSDFSDFVYGMLMVAKGTGLTEKIGVSTSSPMEAAEVLEKYKLDIVQVPCNVLDQRLMDPWMMDKLRGVEKYIRSVFLQGLLLTEPDDLPEYFDPIKGDLHGLRLIAENQDISMLKMCLDFVRSNMLISNIIVGVESVKQLSDIINAYKQPNSNPQLRGAAIRDSKFINPGLWPVGGWLK
jgi:aryl-alcohol dehydrogenase-like predicted oxidoreductase